MTIGLPFEAMFAAGAAGISALAILARHERRTIRARRELIVDPIREGFEDQIYSTDGSGIPRIEGTYRNRHLRIDLIPDTMTIRRLPQLWVSVTALKALAAPGAGFAVLVRPSGADFYSLTERMGERLEPPPGFPWECLVRGQSAASHLTLERAVPAISRILADAKVKEIAATNRGVRIVYQLAEGRRGSHLLLRQCDFEEARLERELLDRLVDDLDALAACFGESLEKTS